MLTLNLANWVKESSPTTGIGSLLMGGAVDNGVTLLQAFGTGVTDDIPYALQDNGIEVEAGVGSFDGTTLIFTRGPTSTFVGGVYDDTSPAPVNLQGPVVIGVTLNAIQFAQLLSDVTSLEASFQAHAGDFTLHLTADQNDALDGAAAPSALNPIATMADVDVVASSLVTHAGDFTLHLTADQNDAVDGANTPSAVNVFATMADVPPWVNVDNTPTTGHTADAISSDWAYRHENELTAAYHMTSDQNDAMDGAVLPSAANPLATMNEIQAVDTALQNHTVDFVLHVTADQNDALDGATTPSAANPFATMNEVQAVDTALQNHTVDFVLHVTANQNAALDAANAPSGANPFATSDDLQGFIKNVVEDPTPTLGGDLETDNHAIIVQDATAAEQGRIFTIDDGLATVHLQDPVLGFDPITDAGMLATAGRLQLFGQTLSFDSMSGRGENQLHLSDDGVVYTVTPPSPGWSVSDSDVGVYPVTGPAPGPWVELTGLVVTIPQDVAAGERLDAVANVFMVNASATRGGSVDIGFGFNGSAPTAVAVNVRVEGDFEGNIPMSAGTTTHGGLLTGTTVSVFVRRASQDHSQFDPIADGSTGAGSEHELIVSIPGGTSAPTNLGNVPNSTTVTITSSTGSGTVIAGAVSGTAGVMTGAQVDALTALQPPVLDLSYLMNGASGWGRVLKGYGEATQLTAATSAGETLTVDDGNVIVSDLTGLYALTALNAALASMSCTWWLKHNGNTVGFPASFYFPDGIQIDLGSGNTAILGLFTIDSGVNWIVTGVAGYTL